MKQFPSSHLLDTSKFVSYFGGNTKAHHVHLEGNRFPVATYYIEAAYRYCKVIISRNEPKGDILVFMPGEIDIEMLADEIRKRHRDVEVLPLYLGLSWSQQNAVHHAKAPNFKRRVVIATNIAEASITIDGIVFVVDVEVGEEVGYRVRFEHKVDKNTLLEFVTDGTLVQESQRTPLFNKYSYSIFSFIEDTSISLLK
ncbi:hypothetical protein F5Y08DRAFT_51804 [Xylaria arbuscula]|nr:hypothetical protein F5Y08DRAFT_51804 [Xylaria arbuscula]